jgi:hypothetical protein
MEPTIYAFMAAGEAFVEHRKQFNAFIDNIMASAELNGIPSLKWGTPTDGSLEFTFLGGTYTLRHRFQWDDQDGLSEIRIVFPNKTEASRAVQLTRTGSLVVGPEKIRLQIKIGSERAFFDLMTNP